MTIVSLYQRLAPALAPLALVAVNLLPLAGVLWWGWNFSMILVMYWAETGILAVFAVPMFVMTRSPSRLDLGAPRNPVLRARTAGCLLGMYAWAWLALGVPILLLPLLIAWLSHLLSGASGPVPWPNLAPVLMGSVILALGQFVALVRHHDEMLAPDRFLLDVAGRSVLLVLVLGAGIVGYYALGATTPALLALVGLKTAADLVAYVRRRRHPAVLREGSMPAGPGVIAAAQPDAAGAVRSRLE